MRVSAFSTDPDYNDPSVSKVSYAVYLDGKLLPFAMAADDQAGYVDVACVPAGEAVSFDDTVTTQRLYGSVRILPVRHR